MNHYFPISKKYHKLSQIQLWFSVKAIGSLIPWVAGAVQVVF